MEELVSIIGLAVGLLGIFKAVWPHVKKRTVRLSVGTATILVSIAINGRVSAADMEKITNLLSDADDGDRLK